MIALPLPTIQPFDLLRVALSSAEGQRSNDPRETIRTYGVKVGTDKVVGRLSPHCSKSFPWELDRWIVGS